MKTHVFIILPGRSQGRCARRVWRERMDVLYDVQDVMDDMDRYGVDLDAVVIVQRRGAGWFWRRNNADGSPRCSGIAQRLRQCVRMAAK